MKFGVVYFNMQWVFVNMQLVESIVGGAWGGEGGQDCCHIVLFFKGTIFEFQPYMRCIGTTINIFTNKLQNISFKKMFLWKNQKGYKKIRIPFINVGLFDCGLTPFTFKMFLNIAIF